MSSCKVCKRSTSNECSNCGTVFYCDTSCQKRDWNSHKSICGLVGNRVKDLSTHAAQCSGSPIGANSLLDLISPFEMPEYLKTVKFYGKNLTRMSAHKMLAAAPVGTFLARPPSDNAKDAVTIEVVIREKPTYPSQIQSIRLVFEDRDLDRQWRMATTFPYSYALSKSCGAGN